MNELGKTLSRGPSNTSNKPTRVAANLFLLGDWVWLHMCKEQFPTQRRSKLLPCGDGPFQVIEHVNDNAYKLDLPGEYNVSTTCNVSNLSLFYADSDLRTNPI